MKSDAGGGVAITNVSIPPYGRKTLTMAANIQIGDKEYSPDELVVLAKAGVLNVGQKHDTSSTTPSAAPLHGPFPGNANQFGVFSTPGGNPNIWNATPRVRSFASAIPMYPTTIQQELIDIATGVTVGSGSNQTSACVVGPKPGALKAGRITATFGIVHESTKIFDVTQAGMRRNRADVDRNFYNSARIQNNWLPDVPGIDGQGTISSVLRAELLALGIDLERNISQVHFLGVAGAENDTYRGIARQWNGLDQLIKTGYADSVSTLVMPAADSTVVSFNADADGGTDSFSRTLVAALIDTYYAQVDYLNLIGVIPVFALVMRPDMFRAIAQVWSCAYATTRCLSSSAGVPVLRDATAIRAEYEQMLAGQYLPMEGTNVPVLLDDSIARDTVGSGHFKSDLYGVALSGNGIPVVYGEYFDMNNPEAMEVVNSAGMANDGSTTTINNGLYRVFKRVTGGCIEYDFYARPRLITTAPFMHFRIDDIRYKSAYNQRDAVPGMSYYANGGRSYAL